MMMITMQAAKDLFISEVKVSIEAARKYGGQGQLIFL